VHLKEISPVEVSEYAAAMIFLDAPVFFGGPHMYSISAVELFLLKQSVNISTLTSLELKFPRAGMTV
jgi:hypothetical protein